MISSMLLCQVQFSIGLQRSQYIKTASSAKKCSREQNCLWEAGTMHLNNDALYVTSFHNLPIYLTSSFPQLVFFFLQSYGAVHQRSHSTSTCSLLAQGLETVISQVLRITSPLVKARFRSWALLFQCFKTEQDDLDLSQRTTVVFGTQP